MAQSSESTQVDFVILVAREFIHGAEVKPTVSYTALSDAARASGRLKRYDKCPTTSGAIRLGHYKLAQPAGTKRAARRGSCGLTTTATASPPRPRSGR